MRRTTMNDYIKMLKTANENNAALEQELANSKESVKRNAVRVVERDEHIAELQEEQVDDYLEASTYALSLFNAHYKNRPDAVPLELCDTTRGVVTQIDNMVTGVIAELEKKLPAPMGLWVTSKDLKIWKLEQQAKSCDWIYSNVPDLSNGNYIKIKNRSAVLTNQAKALKEPKL
jgi:hypothetical protein